MNDDEKIVDFVAGRHAIRQNSVVNPDMSTKGRRYNPEHLQQGSFGVMLTVDMRAMQGHAMTPLQLLALQRVLIEMQKNLMNVAWPTMVESVPDVETPEQPIVPMSSKDEELPPAATSLAILLGGVAENERKAVQVLFEQGRVTEEEIEQASQYAIENGVRVLDALTKFKFISSSQRAQAIAEQHGLAYVDLDNLDIPPEVLEAVPRYIVVEHRIVPVLWKRRSLVVASETPLDYFALDNLRFLLNTEVECVIAEKDALNKAIEKYYPDTSVRVVPVDDEQESFSEFMEHEQRESVWNSAAVITALDLILLEGIKSKATQVIISVGKQSCMLRMVVDGAMCVMNSSPPFELRFAIISRIKYKADLPLDINAFQVGLIEDLTLGGRTVKIGVTICENKDDTVAFLQIEQPKKREGGEDGPAPVYSRL